MSYKENTSYLYLRKLKEFPEREKMRVSIIEKREK